MKNPEWEKLRDEAADKIYFNLTEPERIGIRYMHADQIMKTGFGAGANWAAAHFEQKLEAAEIKLIGKLSSECLTRKENEMFARVYKQAAAESVLIDRENEKIASALTSERQAREAAEKRVLELEKALRLALPYVERDIIAAVKENFGFVSNDSWANKSCDDRDLIVNTLEGRNE
jgi:hypothetical protein